MNKIKKHIRNLVKKARSNEKVNRAIAIVLKYFKLNKFTSHWPLCGVIKINILSKSVLFKSNCDDYLLSNLYYGHDNEEIIELETIIKFYNLDEKLCFLDIGTYNGLFSLFIAKHFKNSIAFGFEPNPANYYRTLENIALNHLENIHIENIGISDTDSRLDFFLPKDKSLTTISSYQKSFAQNHCHTDLIKYSSNVKSLDLVVKELNIKPDAIKIDVEGHEFEVIKGSLETIKLYKPLILCEMFTKEYSDVKEYEKTKFYKLEMFFRKLDYGIYTIDNNRISSLSSLNFTNSNRNLLFRVEK